MSYTGSLWVTDNGAYELLIPDDILKTAFVYCSRAGANETGGIIIGHYVEENTRAVVTALSSPPTDSQSGPAWFQRGILGLEHLLFSMWRRKERRYYIGEWHYHPTGHPRPSATDIEQMKQIANSEHYHSHTPIMMILGRGSNDGPNVGAWVFSRDGERFDFHLSQEST